MAKELTTKNDTAVVVPTRKTGAQVVSEVEQIITSKWSLISGVAQGELTAKRLLNIYISVMSRNPKLLECSPMSLVRCFMLSSELGLPIGSDGMSLAYAIPFKNNKTGKTEAVFMPSYRGLSHLAVSSGAVKHVYGKIVYENEIAQGRFELVEGLHPNIIHRPLLGDDRGGIYGVYAIAVLDNGLNHMEWLSKGDLDRIRACSRAQDSGPWVEWPEMMSIKSGIKRVLKYVPDRPIVARAVELDTAAEIGGTQMLPPGFENVCPDEPTPSKTSLISQKLKDKAANEEIEDVPEPEEEDTHIELSEPIDVPVTPVAKKAEPVQQKPEEPKEAESKPFTLRG